MAISADSPSIHCAIRSASVLCCGRGQGEPTLAEASTDEGTHSQPRVPSRQQCQLVELELQDVPYPAHKPSEASRFFPSVLLYQWPTSLPELPNSSLGPLQDGANQSSCCLHPELPSVLHVHISFLYCITAIWGWWWTCCQGNHWIHIPLFGNLNPLYS